MASTGPGADIPTLGSIFSCPGPSPLPHRYEVSDGHFGDNIPCHSGGGGWWICGSSSLPPPPGPAVLRSVGRCGHWGPARPTQHTSQLLL